MSHDNQKNNSNYNMQSRGYKTKGNSYKDRYVEDKFCPECGGTSIYKDEWSSVISYKCIRRSCRYQWFEHKNKPKKETDVENIKEIEIEEKERQEQIRQKEINNYLMTIDLDMTDRIDDTTYSVVGYREDRTTEVVAEHVTFDIAIKKIKEHNDSFLNVSIIEEKDIVPLPSDLYIIANAEGYIEETRELFYRPIYLNETFVLAGNFAGAKNFPQFMKYLLAFKEKRPCIFIRGKNEHNILERINGTEDYIGNIREVRSMINAIENSLGYHLMALPHNMPKVYQLINNTKDYFENDTHIIVSGGVDLSMPFWKQSTKESLYNTSDEFLKYENYTDKTIIFGDKTTQELSSDERSYGIWQNKKGDKVGINGNCPGGKKLLGLSILKGEMNYLTARNKEKRKKRLQDKYPNGINDDF